MPDRRPLKKNEIQEWTIARLLVLALDNIYKNGDATPAIQRIRRELEQETAHLDVSDKVTRTTIKRVIVTQSKAALANLRNKTNA